MAKVATRPAVSAPPASTIEATTDTLFKDAVALQAAKRYEEALACYDRLTVLDPEVASVWYNRGLVLKALGRLEEAASSYERAIEADPTHANAWYNKGNLLRFWQPEEALRCFDRVVQLDAKHASAWHNRGVIFQKVLLRVEDAVKSYDRAIAVKPDHAEAWNNRGAALENLGRLSEALVSYERAIALDAENPRYWWNKGLLKLLEGEYEEGWRLFEFGTKQPLIRSMPYALLPGPKWLGRESLKGRTILLHHEQGLGDTLQFCRYATQVEALGANVVLCVPPVLVRLLQTLSAGIRVINQVSPTELPEHDYQTPLMSLPFAFGTTLKSIPSVTPYLYAEPQAVGRWAMRLGSSARLRVGLVWSGNPRKYDPDAHAVDRQRSLHFSALAPILQVEGVDFYSLQKGEEAVSQLRESPWRDRVIDWTDELQDFADTAALVENLDLVISVDTSMVHLTGALGKPVWMLDRFNNCWRWLKGREDSPWYPSLRLFRQPQLGQWEAVIERVARALGDYARPASDIKPSLCAVVSQGLPAAR